MHTSQLHELQQLIYQTEKKQQLQVSCLLQLKHKRVPTFCYQMILKPKNKNSILIYLDEKCQMSSQNLKNLEEIEQILKETSLSRFCVNKLKQKKAILEYQLRDHSPQKLLNWYL